MEAAPPPRQGGSTRKVRHQPSMWCHPQGTTVGKVSSTRFPCGRTQCGKATGTFHVPTFLVSDSGGPGGEVTADPLQLVRDAYTRRAAHKTPLERRMRPEYADEVAENGYGDRDKLHRGNLQSNREGRSGVF